MTSLRLSLAAVLLTALASAGCDDSSTSRPATSGGSPSASAPSPHANPSKLAEVSRTPNTTPGAPVPDKPLTGRVVGIDPGHNGRNRYATSEIRKQIWNGRSYQDCNTTGTSTDDGYPESRFTFQVASYLDELVHSAGGRTVLTRTSDDGVGPCVDVRARTLNEAAADIAIDIHADGGPASGRGFTILRPVRSGVNDSVVAASWEYADLLKSAMLKTGMPVSDYYGANGFKDRDDLAGLNLTTVPQLLLETGNMRNTEDADLLTSDRFQRRVAQAILDAMVSFLADQADTPSASGR